ncbi:alanine/glycine:cation symporter family protein [Mangrovibacillus cuniculi]|uniref:Sodium:alanine symporter family protein n=1 Tax=Mangrovibacillus cuniculi TaxID=2593652 RepID=A0A7S8CA37_9BACI|nr:sodium:alanine symporter family protein [Mangrovibacillus cuniculi]QPC46003.1 sodium:alanine symporter family protein [Mangrovibacillus cuniculi]
MEQAKEWISKIAEFIWGFPMITLFILAGLYITVRLGFLPFRHFPHIIKMTLGQIGKKGDASSGGISPFAAFTSALSATAGATNIVGVPVAIAFGGPGALFWMWTVALIGMSTIFAELVLGMTYREKNKEDKWVGGPYYYLSKGLKWDKLAWFYAFGLMIEIVPSVMVQANSVSVQLENEHGFSLLWIGIVLAIVTAFIVFGGIDRIGKLSSKLLPVFVIGYVGLTTTVIIMNGDKFGSVLKMIVMDAFTPSAAVGTFAGASIVQTMRWGLARGLYTSEAGMGTSAIAYASAETDSPVKQSFWGMIAVMIDTLVICTLTGLTVIITGVWKELEPSKAASMVTKAFKETFPDQFSAVTLSVLLVFFVLATVGVIIFYGESQAELLFGKKVKYVMRVVYLIAIVVGAMGGLKFVWELLDLILFLIVVPNIIGIVFLIKVVKEAKVKYFADLLKEKKKAAK